MLERPIKLAIARDGPTGGGAVARPALLLASFTVGTALMATSWLVAPQGTVVGTQRVEVATFESHDPASVPSASLLSNARELEAVRALMIATLDPGNEMSVSIESVDGQSAVLTIRGEGAAPESVAREVTAVAEAYVAARRDRFAVDVEGGTAGVRDEAAGLREVVAESAAATNPADPTLDVLVPWLTSAGLPGPELDPGFRDDAFVRTMRLVDERRAAARLAWLDDLVVQGNEADLAQRVATLLGSLDTERFPPPVSVGPVLVFGAGLMTTAAGLAFVAMVHRYGRVVVIGCVSLVGGWLVAVAVIAIGIALDGRGALRAARSLEAMVESDDIDLETLEQHATVTDERLSSAGGRLASPVLAPLALLPTVGAQIESAKDAVEVARWISGAASGIAAQRLADGEDGSAWAGALDSMRAELVEAERSAVGLPTIDPSSFPGRLREDVQELIEAHDRAMTLVRNGNAAFGGFVPLLRGEGTYLIVAGNNAEMRNNTAAFLMVGEVSLEDGRPVVSRLLPRGKGVDLEGADRGFPPIERGAVEISQDMQRNWGFFGPDVDVNFLGLTADYAESARIFADMWTVVFGESVDGVIYMDTRALVDLATASGPVRIDGDQMSAPELLDELLLRQYEIEDRFERQSRLIRITEDVVGSVVDRSSLGDLIPTFRRLVQERHVMVWAQDPAAQLGLDALGLAGTLSPATLGIGLPALAGKNDHLLSVSIDVSVACMPATAELEVRLTMSYPPDVDIAKTDNSDWSWWGEPDLWYLSMPSLRLPIGATGVRLGGDPARHPVREGRTQIITTEVVLPPGGSDEVTLLVSVPAGSALQVLPDGRAVPTNWSIPDAPCVSIER